MPIGQVPWNKGARESISRRRSEFARLYAETLNPVVALRGAGYRIVSEAAGRRKAERLLRRHPHILEMMKKRGEATLNRAQIDQEYVLRHIQNVVEKASVKDSDKLSALKMLGEYLALFTHRTINETTVEVRTPEEVAKDNRTIEYVKSKIIALNGELNGTERGVSAANVTGK